MNSFGVVDEFHARLPLQRVYNEQKYSRAARFQLNPKDSDEWSGESFYRPQYTLLDEIMSEITGKGCDNYPGNLTDEAFDLPAHSMGPDKKRKLNSAYSHRCFRGGTDPGFEEGGFG